MLTMLLGLLVVKCHWQQELLNINTEEATITREKLR